MPTETKTEKTAEKPAYKPRKLKLITKTARGWDYLVDAENGEDLRLPFVSLTKEPTATGANVHCTFEVAVEREKK